MNIEEFQSRLTEVQKMAADNGKQISAGEVENFFGKEVLTKEQLIKVFAYLKLQGIEVEGAKEQMQPETKTLDALRKTPQENSMQEKAETAVVPLNREELEYLVEYEKSLRELEPEKEGERFRLFAEAVKKVDSAKKRLIELYLREAVEAAKEMHREGQFVGDLIAEGNVGLIMAVENLNDRMEDFHEYLCREIRLAIEHMLEEQELQREEDHILVEKVENLENRMKDILEDEESKYSVEELSVFLDMDVEEIHSVLRLTGDDQ